MLDNFYYQYFVIWWNFFWMNKSVRTKLGLNFKHLLFPVSISYFYQLGNVSVSKQETIPLRSIAKTIQNVFSSMLKACLSPSPNLLVNLNSSLKHLLEWYFNFMYNENSNILYLFEPMTVQKPFLLLWQNLKCQKM